MKTYPSIDGSSKAPRATCHVFVKYDGSSIRAEWSAKRGWYKFGTRTQLLDPNDPIFGRAVPLFLAKYGDELAKVFRTEKFFRSVNNVVVFFEYFGSKSFAGMHFPDDPLYDVVLFDVAPYKKCILGPKEFLDLFGHLPVAELLHIGNMNDELIQAVRQETIPLESKYEIRTEIPEGVICKGGREHKLWMCKIKTERYRAELKKRYEVDWSKYWE